MTTDDKPALHPAPWRVYSVTDQTTYGPEGGIRLAPRPRFTVTFDAVLPLSSAEVAARVEAITEMEAFLRRLCSGSADCGWCGGPRESTGPRHASGCTPGNLLARIDEASRG